MTKSSSRPPASSSDTLTVPVRDGDDPEKASTKFLTGPFVTNAYALTKYSKGCIGEMKLDHVVSALIESATAVKANQLEEIEELLTSQAIVLNTMFGELARRSAANMGDYIDAAQRYHNMAMKAQNQCRMTLETLSTIKNPPVIYARQANIAHGPQQVNNGVPKPSHAEKSEIPPNKLLENTDEQSLDAGTPGEAGESYTELATLEKRDRTPIR